MNDRRVQRSRVTVIRTCSFLVGLLACALTADVVRAAPPVQFELITESGYPQTESQRWVQFLSKLELTSIRIRQAQAREHESITNIGKPERPLYLVVGVLTSQNRLRLPGGEFAIGDRERLSAWLKKVETEGGEAPTQQTTAFGLTAEQLVTFHEKLAAAVPCESKGRRCGDVARDLVKAVGLPFTVSESARQGFAAGEICEDDLQSLSCGTALAAVIRPLGLVFRPEKSGKSVHLLICEVRETDEAWPIGWPSEDTPGKLAPKLFESLQVEIKDVAMSKALAAIQPRVAIPFLLDHNGMARQRIDLTTVKVKYPSSRAMYRKVLDQILYQSKLSSDLRVDEAGQPFLWISPR